MKTSLHRKLMSLLLIALLFILPLTIHAEADTDETTTEATEEMSQEETQEGQAETTETTVPTEEASSEETEEPTTETTAADETDVEETEETQTDVAPEPEPEPANIPAGIFYLQQREKITVEPDYAEIELGVSTRNADFATAVSELRTAAETLKGTLQGSSAITLGIENLHFQVWNEQDYNQSPPVIHSYVPRQMYLVTVHDVEQVGAVLDMAIQAGSNELGSINFKSSEEDTKTLEVRQKALAVLDEKAERLVKAMATPEAASTLERYDVNYSTLRPGLRSVEFETAETSTMAMRDMAATNGMGAAGAPVSPGLLELEYVVHASYVFGEADVAKATSGHLPQVSVDGDATFAVEPDTFRVVFGKDTTSVNSAKEAVAENDAVFNAVTEELTALGITEDELQTTQYSVNPYHTYNTEYPEVAGFTVSHYMELTIPADENIKPIMDVILAANLSIIQEGYYYLDDQTVVRQEITVDAARDAHAQFVKLDDREPQAVIITEVPQMYYYYSSYGGGSPDRTAYDVVSNMIPPVELSEYVKVDFILDK